MPGLTLILGIARLFMGAGNLIKLGITTGLGVWAALPNWAKTLTLVVAAGVVVYYVGEHNGSSRIQTKWDAAVATAVERANQIGNKANADAEKSVPALSPTDRANDAAIVPRGKPCVVRDRFDRDCAGH